MYEVSQTSRLKVLNDRNRALKKGNEEYSELIKWAIVETEKIYLQLSEAGISSGLDTNREAYEEIHKELKRKTLDLYDKYNLPKNNIQEY